MPIAVTMPAVFPESQKLLDMGVRIALTLVAAFVVQRLMFVVVARAEHLVERAAGRRGEQAGSRARTLGQVMRSLITSVIIAAAVIHSLAILGWNVAPLLAGAGILGVALGFGAQSLVRDWIAGIYILLENQFAVGDVIEVNGRAATVEEIKLRATTLRDFNGYVHFVPNGEMKVVTNRSRGWNRIAVDVPVHASEDVDRALAECRQAIQSINAEAGWSARLLEPVNLWGVESLGAGEAQIRIVARAKPGSDAAEGGARSAAACCTRSTGRASATRSPSRERLPRRLTPSWARGPRRARESRRRET